MSKQKIEISVETPEGYEATGEYRDPKVGELYFSPATLCVCVCRFKDDGYKIILRKVEPVKKMRPMTAEEIACLPRGTAFVRPGVDSVYNPVINWHADGTMAIQGCHLNSFKGYRLTGETTIRPFTVEATNDR